VSSSGIGAQAINHGTAQITVTDLNFKPATVSDNFQNTILCGLKRENKHFQSRIINPKVPRCVPYHRTENRNITQAKTERNY
jgi:hypothetical protein